MHNSSSPHCNEAAEDFLPIMTIIATEKVWADGCYDLFHYGHANGFRQARAFGSALVAGVHSNDAILSNKGLPVMEDSERYEMIKACRWVDEVVEDAPFVTSMSIVKAYGCTIVSHADDAVSDANGYDCYHEAKTQKAYREFERTHGISTTNLVGRILLRRKSVEKNTGGFKEYQEDLVAKFSESIAAGQGKNIVFVDGMFDLFHAGHVHILKQARERGDRLVVGLYSDEEACRVYGEYPVLSFLERKLALLACKYVDEIVAVCSQVTSDFLTSLDVKCVVHGQNRPPSFYANVSKAVKVVQVDHAFSYLTQSLIIRRIFESHQKYEQRNIKRA